ncbi:NAD(+) diphosphatase [Peteryoungia desertarenae]|uniref:NAD(+) diphosphatase n=1 Tax=Peteryoungia desertarenae TaxID=1813451 RepID=A0ABX6QKB8_9HYPH|nr:NAD(+) diphosphatase [Peteryoungia desertarenae]QLF69011.1 NAD(+) diphosphatase [Peteryoungia desertarenae]
MSISIFDTAAPHPEASALTAFSGNGLDRYAEHRNEDSLAEAFALDGMHILAFAGNALVLKHDGQVLDPLFAPYELADLEPDLESAILLGRKPNGEYRIAVPVRATEENLTAQYKLLSPRALFREEGVDPELVGEAAQGFSLLHWNKENRFCGGCGKPVETRIGGYKRECIHCSRVFFPRTDPVVIMMTIDEANDRCLLGRGAHFPEGMYSCLAGFIEPAETIESAVRRETFEESGIVIGRVRYHASQPWPMPHQLMIGCYAEALSLEVTRDEAELADCRWFTRDEVQAMIDHRSEIEKAPNDGTIANRLMRDWLDWPRG